MLGVLRHQRAHEACRLRVDDEHGREHGRRASRRALRERVELRQQLALHDERIVGRKRGEPALGGSGVAQGLRVVVEI